MKVIFMAGAGGVGKTVVMNGSEELGVLGVVARCANGIEVNNQGDDQFARPKIKVQDSIVRGFYAEKGIRREADQELMTQQERSEFQQELFHFYLDNLEVAIDAAEREGMEFLILDRSPYDHIAYLMYQSIGLLTLPSISVLFDEADEVMSQIKGIIFMFPYPCDWSPPFKDPDNFRQADPIKNLIISQLILYNVERFEEDRIFAGNRDFLVEDILGESIEDRVEEVVSYIGGYTRGWSDSDTAEVPNLIGALAQLPASLMAPSELKALRDARKPLPIEAIGSASENLETQPHAVFSQGDQLPGRL